MSESMRSLSINIFQTLMSYKNTTHNFYFFLFAIVILFHSCRSARSITAPKNYHSFYDDSTLTLANKPVLLPYNRFLNPEGTVVKFGENVMVVEDRYGLTFINVLTAKVLYHLNYKSSKTNENLMSTYSGLKIIEMNNRKYIFWGAANLGLKKSYIVEAEWNNQK